MYEEIIYRKFIDNLHENDIGNYIKLPLIAVMGDTSSGKSSVLSAITNIEFPANDKLTTRCPMRVRIERKYNKSAKVFIKWHEDSDYKDKMVFDPIIIDDKKNITRAIYQA
jgi:hypothetical protein